MDNRWKCPHCGAEGWGTYGPHDRTSGRPCRPSGARTEREVARALRNHLRAERHARAYALWTETPTWRQRLEHIRSHRDDFRFSGLFDMLQCVRGQYYGNDAGTLLRAFEGRE